VRTHRPPHPRRRGDKSAGTGTPAWQAVGLPGSDGWLARMQRQGPDGRAAVMTGLQQGAGNRAMAQAVARAPSAGGLFSTFAEGAASLIDRAMSFTLEGTVGRNGKNAPQDVERVRARLKSLGFPTTDDPATLEAAIERYQRDVVGLRKPDGRVDPAGRTLAALNQGQAAAPVGAPEVPGAAKPADATAGAPPADPAATSSAPAAAPLKDAGPPADIDGLAQRSSPLRSALDALKRLQEHAATAQEDAQKIDQAERNKKKGEPKGETTLGQEWGEERDKLVAEIKTVRKLIDELKSSSGLSAAEVASVMAYLYRELARVAPYYFQMVNANILEKDNTKAGGRTCNVTSLAMTLEALGKSSKDYAGPEVRMLPLIAKVLPGRVDTAVDRVAGEEEMAALRLPDFLQILAVSKFLEVDPELAGTDPKAFLKAVEKARNEAAGKITQSGWFDKLIGDFGVKVDNESPFGRMKVSGSDVNWSDAIERVGEINRGSLPDARKNALKTKQEAEAKQLTDEARAAAEAQGKTLDKRFKPKVSQELTKEERAATDANTIDFFNTQRPGAVAAREKRLAEVEEALKGASGAEKRELAKEKAKLKEQISEGKRDKPLADLGIHSAATDAKQLNKILPIETYASVVSAALSKHLDAGHQVVGHMYNHYFRIEAVTSEGVVIDDPGSWKRRSHLMTWEEARSLGSFSRFTYVKPK
jgi:hypothetical protein